MFNIDRLLKKGKWTGQELGRLEVINAMYEFKQYLDGTLDSSMKRATPLITDAELRKMIDTIDKTADARVFNGYLSIHEWFGNFYDSGQGVIQQFYANYAILSNTIVNAHTGEELYTYISRLPAIMTEKQYKDIVAKRTQEILHPEGLDIGFNLFNMLEKAILFYVAKLQKEPRKSNPLKPLKKKLQKEPVVEKRILSRYNEVMGCGYYQLPDGTRSDKATEEEWTEALKPYIETLKKDSSFTGMEVKQIALSYLNSNTIVSSLKERLEGKEYTLPVWHYNEEPPADLNKWEILETGDLCEYFPALEGQGTDEECIEDMKAFKEEFPELTDVLLKDMEKYISGVSSIPVEEWLCTVYMWEDLYKIDFYGFRTMYVENDTTIFDGDYRAIFNGIAILRPSNLLSQSTCIDPETGYYKAPPLKTIIADLGLEGYFPESENYGDNLETIEQAREIIIESIYYLRNYNYTLELVGDYYKIPEITVGKLDLTDIEECIDSYNGLVNSLYERIKRTYYEDEELKQKKLDVLTDILYPISLDGLEIPEHLEKQALEYMKDFSCFKDPHKDLKLLLCVKDPEGKGA